MKEENIYKKLGINYLYPYQELVVKSITDAVDAEPKVHQLIVLPTGYGKTLCFTIAALSKGNKTLVLYPLRSLLFDQKKRLSKSCNVCAFYGGQTNKERKELFDDIDNYKMILVSYEVLLVNSVFRVLMEQKFDLVVYDEAHTLVTWGFDFRFTVLEAIKRVHLLNFDIITLFTATCDNQTKTRLEHFVLFDLPCNQIIANIDRPNITYYSIPTLSRFRTIRTLLSNKELLPAIIFCKERSLCETFANQIKTYLQDEVYYYHSKLTIKEKKEVEDKFKESSTAILCSTNAYGMGVDKKNIRTVIHTEIFGTPSSFLQESGRAARDGNPGYSFILKYTYLRNDEMTNIFINDKCIREKLINKMDLTLETCNGCSCCNNIKFKADPIAKKIIRLVMLHPLYYTAETILPYFNSKDYINYLRQDYKTSRYDINTLELRQIINNLVNLKVLKRKKRAPFFRHLYLCPNYKKKLFDFYNVV